MCRGAVFQIGGYKNSLKGFKRILIGSQGGHFSDAGYISQHLHRKKYNIKEKPWCLSSKCQTATEKPVFLTALPLSAREVCRL